MNEEREHDRFELTLQTDDGTALDALLLVPTAPKRAVLISSGTGFRKEFYLSVANYFVDRGVAVLIYDFRGIGGSASKVHLVNADLPDWGRLDMKAAIQALDERFPHLPISHIGHSAGGHLVGFAENQTRISSHVFVACGSGTWYRHPPHRWLVELYLWWGLGTVSLALWGHLKKIGGWTGDPLPGPLFRTWRRWSQQPRYYRHELQTTLAPHNFEKVTSPIASWVFSDDSIATPQTARDILEAYPNAPSQIVITSPSDLDVPKIGHQGCFRPGFELLWESWLDWIDSTKPGNAMPNP